MTPKIWEYTQPDYRAYSGGLSHDEEWAPEGQYVSLEDYEALEARCERLEHCLRQEIALMKVWNSLTTHYQGCEEDHRICRSIKRIEAALQNENAL